MLSFLKVIFHEECYLHKHAMFIFIVIFFNELISPFRVSVFISVMVMNWINKALKHLSSNF